MSAENKHSPLLNALLLILFGLGLAFVLTEAGLRAAAFFSAPAKQAATAKDGTLRILCLGESTTARGSRDSWPAQLEEILGTELAPDRVKIFNRGREGIMSSWILARAEDLIDECRPQVAVVMMGVNDDPDLVAANGRNIFSRALTHLKTAKLLRILAARIQAKLNELSFFARNTPGIEALPLPAPTPDMPERKKRTARSRPEVAALFEAGQAAAAQGDLRAALEHFTQASALDPQDKEPFILSGDCLARAGRYEEAADNYGAAARLDPADEQPLIALGHCRMKQGRFNDARAAYESALEINPDENRAWERLAACLRETGRYGEVREVYERGMLRPNPDADLAVEYFRSLTQSGAALEDREKALIEAMARFPGDSRPRALAGFLYMDEIKDFGRAQELFERALTLDPKEKHFIYLCLADICNIRQDKEALARHAAMTEELVNAGTDEADPIAEARTERLSAYLALYFRQTGDNKKAARYYARARAMRNRFISAMTRGNYRKLAALLKRRGVRLVAMQYPMRPLSALERLFDGDTDIVFVGNEGNFRRAVAEEGYESCFTDHFAGDFGHATRRGNRLIAQSAARAISGRVLGRR